MKKISISRKNICWIAAVIIAAVLHVLFFLSTSFSDFFNTNIASFFRFLLAKLTDILPFSLAEILLFLALPAAILIAFVAIKACKTLVTKLCFVAAAVLKILAVVYILFVLTFASGYGASGIDERLGLNRQAVSAEELYETLVYVIDKTNDAAAAVEYTSNGASEMPFDTLKLSDKLCASYDVVYGKYPLGSTFSSNVKPLIVSPYMTYTHISGVYSFFTGEANMNTNYPDYVCVYTAAHELAHQRGVAREDEANFIAYLICTSSDDPYIIYSGYLNMYSYLADALYSADRELYFKAVENLSENARGELRAYSEFFDKYRDSTASEISDAVNDTYLKSQGTAGVASYGMVVDLAVAYHKVSKG